MLARMGQGLWRHKGWAAIGSAAAVLCLAGVAVGHAAAASADLLKVRLGGDAAQTRIVIDLDRSASAKLVSDGAADRRVTVVLPGVTAAGGLQGGGHGLVRAWMVDQTAAGARLQMDLSADAKVKRRFLLPPADGVDHYRYVVDLAPLPPAEVKLAKATAPKLRPRLLPVRGELSLKKVVVIDAGHGGNDPGARGAEGFEKDLNLAAARQLKARLERSGRYKVIMTRETDAYVGLASRVRIAQRADADLFISLHADSGPEPGLRGASVYTLSDKASARAAQFVSKDDWFMKASLSGDRGVSDILLDLTQRATRNRSAAFAQTLVSNIEGEAPLLRRSHRDAGFMVLLAPDVPAVLLEMGFISNPEDEVLLRDVQRRGALMNAVGDAIDDYFAETTRLAAR
ncbi:N-acetylmuramoyl-L-alanine amidase [Phenylobacterium sp.]|uniref:N-acetylmuramoyl-L-alanine amidase family protein n=1 Tax=Phenylobacterium sp. TaxID=1871053 RepID=UPI002C8DB657|nr:N-acetylmuramoyl-L-alanine amidase [Phenylobacterium sp.]HVI30992.1 N-acetylmuramoyl-L-alanine amidase [Phenylobacterium sp.]